MRRSGSKPDAGGSGADSAANRDLLLGLPKGNRASDLPPSTPRDRSREEDRSLQREQTAAIREVLTTVRKTGARLDAMSSALSPAEAIDAFSERTTDLWKAIEEARRAITSAADRAAGRREEAASANKAVSDAASKLTAEGTKLNRKLAEVAAKADAVTERQLRLTAETQAAAGRLGSAAEELDRRKTSFRLHLRLYGLLLLLSVCASVVLGAMLQRETGIANFGNPRHEWRAFVMDRYAPILAACGARASAETGRCAA